MKNPFPLLLLLVAGMPALSQVKENLEVVNKSTVIKGSFEGAAYSKSDRLPFREIIVFDKRYDTSKTGYMPVSAKNYSRVEINQSWSSLLNSYFKKNLDSQSNKSLVIFIKSFWLQAGPPSQLVKSKVSKESGFAIGNPFSNERGTLMGSCSAALDMFVQTDSTLQALFKLDTCFLNMSRYKKNKLDDVFFLPFDSLARKLQSTLIPEVVAKRKKLSWTEVHNYYNNRFSLPILSNTQINKGVFHRFEDFRLNNPSSAQFSFKNGKLTDELYIVSGGQEQLITEYWGFFDGKDLYIQAGMSAFKAVRQNNTFEFYGSNQVSTYFSSTRTSIMQRPGDISFLSSGMVKTIFQVNMDTGKVY